MAEAKNTDQEMEVPKNLQDCYFFYYSTCKKGSSCSYRHEPSCLGHEEVCKLWLESKCFNRQCTMRHMKIQKPRSQVKCYWEDQPQGCMKPHCVFQHRLPRRTGAGGSSNQGLLQLPMGAPGGLILVPRIL